MSAKQLNKGAYRENIRPGLQVSIILKKDQRSGTLTEGTVRDVLTKAPVHTRGIKVRLEDGQVGRVAHVHDGEIS
ncbi:MAG TPA: YwbE family protein [Calditrichia bacterium]|nr:YwbE family protein [Calditrichia bacterium]